MKKDAIILLLGILIGLSVVGIFVSSFNTWFFDKRVNTVEEKIDTISELLKLDEIELIEIEE